jgi:hypothetical protein
VSRTLEDWAKAAALHEDDKAFWAVFRDWAEENCLGGVLKAVDYLETRSPVASSRRRKPHRIWWRPGLRKEHWWWKMSSSSYDPANGLPPKIFENLTRGQRNGPRREYAGDGSLEEAYLDLFRAWQKVEEEK